MPSHPIFRTPFAKVYPMYVQKAQRKNRTQAEVDRVICWLTGYDEVGLRGQIDAGVDLETFFGQSPRFSKDMKVIQLDISPEEIHHNKQTEVALVGDGLTIGSDNGGGVCCNNCWFW